VESQTLRTTSIFRAVRIDTIPARIRTIATNRLTGFTPVKASSVGGWVVGTGFFTTGFGLVIGFGFTTSLGGLVTGGLVAGG